MIVRTNALLILLAAGGTLGAAEHAPLQPDAFLARYCLDCHGAEKHKGDRRFDNLPLQIGSELVLAERWREILDQLQLGEMPPEDKQQPSAPERLAVIRWIEGQLTVAQTAAASQAGSVVHRRLSRAEYLHTVRDMFGFEGDFDPTVRFPADEESDGFHNIGSALRTSRHHIEAYLAAADAVIDQAYDLAHVNGAPPVRTWRDTPESCGDLNQAFGQGVIAAEKAEGQAYIHLRHGLRNQELIYDSKIFLKDLRSTGVPHSGWYEIEVEATAANRHHPYGEELMLGLLKAYYPNMKSYYDDSKPMQLGVGRQIEGMKGNAWRLVPPNILQSQNLPDDRYTTLRFRIWLDHNTFPYLSWLDGPPKGTAGNFISTKLYKFDPEVPKIEQKVWENLALRPERDKLYTHRYRGPEVRLRYWQMTGPLQQASPHEAGKLLFKSIRPEATKVDSQRLREELSRLATQFFRREVKVGELIPYYEMLQHGVESGLRYADAVRPVLKALLCSPDFLFLSEPQTQAGAITPGQLANRLSYFLNAGPPDLTLRELAARGTLDAAAIRRETDRLLNSPKSERFLRLFTLQWLGLERLGSMPPGKETFPSYHIDRLEDAMKEETWRFVAELIRTNQPVQSLVEANFTYANAGLSRLYGLPPIASDTLERVNFPTGSGRRGLLGHASVLTVTANGVETSPVKRGVWLLEKILGTPPSPPPPNVPPIEPDIRGATTIRQQLEKHRSVATCADCHAKIDPLGYALEGFDPIGRQRDRYPNGAAIDTSGSYRGQTVNGPDDIRALLARNPDLLARNFAHRMLTYALGRQLGLADQAPLRSLLSDWKDRQYALRDLVHLVAANDLMQKP